MNTLSIALQDNQTGFRPGETVQGTVNWSFADRVPGAVELRLFWFTHGRGTQDVSVVENLRFDRPRAKEARPFRLRLPYAPYSFSGELVSLTWALELVSDWPEAFNRVEIVLSPSAAEIELSACTHSPNTRSRATRGDDARSYSYACAACVDITADGLRILEGISDRGGTRCPGTQRHTRTGHRDATTDSDRLYQPLWGRRRVPHPGDLWRLSLGFHRRVVRPAGRLRSLRLRLGK